MNVHRKLAGGLLAGSLLFTVAACGGDGDSKAGDKLAEKIAKDNGVDVDINSKDGKYTVTDKDGNKTEVGTRAKLPDDWPSDLEPPDSVKIMSSSTSTTNGKKQLSVVATSTTEVQDLYEGLKSQLESNDYEISSDTSGGTGDGAYAALSATKGTTNVNVSMGSSTTGTDGTSIIFTVELGE